MRTAWDCLDIRKAVGLYILYRGDYEIKCFSSKPIRDVMLYWRWMDNSRRHDFRSYFDKLSIKLDPMARKCRIQMNIESSTRLRFWKLKMNEKDSTMNAFSWTKMTIIVGLKQFRRPRRSMADIVLLFFHIFGYSRCFRQINFNSNEQFQKRYASIQAINDWKYCLERG